MWREHSIRYAYAVRAHHVRFEIPEGMTIPDTYPAALALIWQTNRHP